MPAAQTLPHAIDYAGLKARQHGAWSSGDYALIGSTLQIVGEQLCEALDLSAGQRVLDVAAGNGNASLAAARRWCDVTASDYVPALLARTRARAEANGLAMTFREADAENLPFGDASFDVVTSTFGVMFTLDQEKAAAELARVCRPQGRIGLANWTPQGFIGEIFRAIGRYVPPPAGIRSPLLWGTRDHLHDLFGDRAASIRAEPRDFMFRYRSAAHFIDVFRAYYGPMVKAFAALVEAKQKALATDIEGLIARFNRAGDGTMIVPGEYLEVVIIRK
jgi:ubiquinone/menaquinone biosynthesis C-methylase UbiE